MLMATARARESLGVPLVTMAMGELGVVTRVGGGVFGSTLTFAVVPDPTGQETPSAPGQPPLRGLPCTSSAKWTPLSGLSFSFRSL